MRAKLPVCGGAGRRRRVRSQLRRMPAHAHGDMVTMNETFMPGTIVVRTNERRLYFVIGGGQAIAIRSASAGPASNGRELVHRRQIHSPGLVAAGGRQARPSRSCRTSFPAARRITRWASRRCRLPAANTPFTAPTSRARSATSFPTAASACSTRTSPICSAASASARGWWSSNWGGIGKAEKAGYLYGGRGRASGIRNQPDARYPSRNP